MPSRALRIFSILLALWVAVASTAAPAQSIGGMSGISRSAPSGGTPTWVLRAGGVPATIDMDFVNGLYWGGTPANSLNAVLGSVTITPGSGLVITPSATDIVAQGPLLTLLQSGVFSVVFNASVISTAAGNPQLISTFTGDGNHILGLESATTFSSFDGANAPIATLGSGSFTTTATKTGFSISGTSVSLVGNNGTVVIGTYAASLNTQFGFGYAVNGVGGWMNGFIQRITIWPSKISDANLQTLTQ